MSRRESDAYASASDTSDDDDDGGILATIKNQIRADEERFKREDEVIRARGGPSPAAAAPVAPRRQMTTAATRHVAPPQRRGGTPISVPGRAPSARANPARAVGTSVAGGVPPRPVAVREPSRATTTTSASGLGPAATALMKELEDVLADDDAFKPRRATTAAAAAKDAAPEPEWRASMSSAAATAREITRGGEELRERVAAARGKVNTLSGSADLLREIEAMTKELGDGVESFGRELREVAKLNDVDLGD